MLAVRWLGAFGGGNNLHASLEHELEHPSCEVACEPIIGYTSYIQHAHVGLSVSRRAIVKTWHGDVWSKADSTGRLYKTRKPVRSHGECWAHPIYTAIVLDLSSGWRPSKKVAKTISWFSDLYNLPVLAINGKRIWKYGIK